MDSSDWYLRQDGSIRLTLHALLSQLPQGEEVTLAVQADYMLDREGSWSFTVLLDGASMRDGAKLGTAGVYAQPAQPAEGALPEIDRDLELTYAAFGPRGGVMAIACDCHEILDDNGVPLYSWYDGSAPAGFMIQDDTGKTLFAGREIEYYDPESGRRRFVCDVTLPDPEATQLTLTPMRWVMEKSRTRKTFTTQQLKAGVQIPCGPECGVFVRNFTQEGSSFTWQEVPYCYLPDRAELVPEDEGRITLAGGRSGLMTQVRDPHTGVYNCRLDYYAASPQEVASIEQWSVCTKYYEPIRQDAITIPLKALLPAA